MSIELNLYILHTEPVNGQYEQTISNRTHDSAVGALSLSMRKQSFSLDAFKALFLVLEPSE